ncbi:MAG TPA: sulfate ABC transporter substrate-binding protein [Tepidisphaeraceae bacterium]|jgi:sulfate transport system substrate-binding protein
MRRFMLAITAAVSVALAHASVAAAAELTFVSYAVAKPVYAKIIPAFKKQYKADTGEDVTFKESYGASGAQTRAIVGGLEADVLVTNVQAYVDPLVEAGLVSADWAKRLPNGASPASSVIAIVTRPGNPKNIKTWTDITADGIQIVAINPKTSGNARWGVVAGYAALTKTADAKAGEDYVRGLVRNTKTLVSGGREATDAFVKNRVGDVLLTFENEAKFANKVGGQDLPYVLPETNIRVDFPATVIDKNVDKHNTRKAAEAFVKFLFSETAQVIYAENGYRPFDEKVAARFDGEFAKITRLLTIEDVGGWSAVDKALFADGALYDQAQQSGKN